MVYFYKHGGAKTNRERFWNAFAAHYCEQARAHESLFDSFYTKEFQGAVKYTAPDAQAAQREVALARERAKQVILATNPIFPLTGVKTRLGWLGLEAADFDYVTTYENSHYCKPNPDYYMEILTKQNLRAENCLMVGNDVGEDILAIEKVGIKSFLVLDCLINKDGTEITSPQGSFSDMLTYLEQL